MLTTHLQNFEISNKAAFCSKDFLDDLLANAVHLSDFLVPFQNLVIFIVGFRVLFQEVLFG